VLEATVEELAASGVAGLSLEGVARRAGVHKATIYRRWGTRERLVLELMREQAAEAVPVPNTGSLRQDLVALAQAAVGNSASPSVEPILRAIIAELPQNPLVADTARRFWQERMALDGKIIERAIARGDIPPGTDPRGAIEAVLGPLHLRLLITGEPADAAAIQTVVDLAMGGVAGAPRD
jgi:AcrR family transcriptional regulator